MIIGSSVAMGWGVEYEKVFSNRLNKKTRKIGRKTVDEVSGLKMDTIACTRCPKLVGAAAPIAPALTRDLEENPSVLFRNIDSSGNKIRVVTIEMH